MTFFVQGKHVTSLALNSTRKLVAFSEYGDRPLLIVYDLGIAWTKIFATPFQLAICYI
jgi:hypothetical protein